MRNFRQRIALPAIEIQVDLFLAHEFLQEERSENFEVIDNYQ